MRLTHCETEVMTDLLSPPVKSTMPILRWWCVNNIAPDEYKKRYSEIGNDVKDGRMPWEEYESRKKELLEELLRALGEPEQSRPDNDSVLNTRERRVKQRIPSEYRERWEELWREWEEDRISSTGEFWKRWGGAVKGMFYGVKYRNSMFSQYLPILPSGPTHQEESVDATYHNFADRFIPSPLLRHKICHLLSSSLRSLPQERIHHQFSPPERRRKMSEDGYHPASTLRPARYSGFRQRLHNQYLPLPSPRSSVQVPSSDPFSTVEVSISSPEMQSFEETTPFTPQQHPPSQLYECDQDNEDAKTDNSISEYCIEELTQMQTLVVANQPVLATISLVAKALPSSRFLNARQMVQMLESAVSKLGPFFEMMGKGLGNVMTIIQGGLLPVTSGYNAIRKHFRELSQGISQPSVYQDLASEAYSKDLITQAQLSDVFSTNGASPMKQASDFLITIQNRIKRDKKAFDKFVSILKKEPAYEHLVALVGA